MKAIWNGVVLAESNDLERVEGNYYFPKDSLNSDYFTDSETNTICPWKGTASYYSVKVDGNTNADAAWYYPSPKPAASHIQDRVAFWKGIEVVDA